MDFTVLMLMPISFQFTKISTDQSTFMATAFSQINGLKLMDNHIKVTFNLLIVMVLLLIIHSVVTSNVLTINRL